MKVKQNAVISCIKFAERVKLREVVLLAVGMGMTAVAFADMAITENLTLTSDTDWSSQGTVNLAFGTTLDLDGYTLAVDGLAGEGTVRSSFRNLSADTSRASCSDGIESVDSGATAGRAFDSNNRVIVTQDNWPFSITYDFGETTLVNRYIITRRSDGIVARAPGIWTLYGSDDNSQWASLDTQNTGGWGTTVTKTFDFENTTAYRYYKIVIDSSAQPTAQYGEWIEFMQLQYGRFGGKVVSCGALDTFDASGLAVSGDVAFAFPGSGGVFKLPTDSDWTKLGKVSLAADTVIDLNGHDLAIYGLGGAAMFTNSVAGTVSHLRVVFDSDVNNSATAIGGNLVFVKDGTGTYTSSKVQTYTGGTVVAGGTAQTAASRDSYNASYSPYGTGTITVEEGATFLAQNTKAYTNAFVLAGGTLRCKDNADSQWTGMNIMLRCLTADSSLVFDNKQLVVRAYGGSVGGLIDLGGHKLTVSMPKTYDYFAPNSSFTEAGGSIVVNASDPATYLRPDPGAGIDIWATNVNFTVGSRIGGKSDDADPSNKLRGLHVGNYVQTGTYASDTVGKTLKLHVHGTFTAPTNNYFYGCTMEDGSAVDLSMQSGAWSNLSAAGNRRLTFADGSKIYVKVGARAMDENTALITWNAAAKPSNLDTLSFAFAYSDDLPLTKTADSVMGIGPIDTMSLTKDTVWTGSTSPFVSDTIVDLNGHDLTIAGFGEAAMFTNSVAGTVSHLRVVFDSDVNNSATAIGGNLVFVKDGTGTYTSSKVQTYTGGTVVAGGTAQTAASRDSYNASYSPYGTGTITVEEGATFLAQNTKAYTNAFVLAGGTLRCKDNADSQWTGMNIMLRCLTADSSLVFDNKQLVVRAYGGSVGGLIDLGGHKLTVSMPKTYDYFAPNSSFTEAGGSIVVNASDPATYLRPDPGAGIDIWATNVNFTVGSRIGGKSDDADPSNKLRGLHVGNYVQTGTYASDTVGKTLKLHVHGTFTTPTDNFFYACTMENGSTVDLSKRPRSWLNLSAAGNRCLTFADGATVYVKVGDRVLDKNLALVKWNVASKPANLASLRFVFADGAYAGRKLVKRSDGLYPLPKGLVIFVR